MQAGVKFVVFSTLETMPEDVKAMLPEIESGYTVPHFESKARAQVRSTAAPCDSHVHSFSRVEVHPFLQFLPRLE